jgi:hypothetical protein
MRAGSVLALECPHLVALPKWPLDQAFCGPFRSTYCVLCICPGALRVRQIAQSDA